MLPCFAVKAHTCVVILCLEQIKLLLLDRPGYPCYAPRLSLSRNKIIRIFKRESIKKQFFLVDLYTHYKRIGHVIITKPHFSSRDGINSHCRRFN